MAEDSPHVESADFDDSDQALPTLTQAQALSRTLVDAAQRHYDQWDEADEDTYAGGGICHLIADAFVNVLDQAGIEAASVSSSHEQHVYVACRLQEGLYALDLPWHLYERGGGFSWTKLPDVQFAPDWLTWYRVDTDPRAFDAYIEG